MIGRPRVALWIKWHRIIGAWGHGFVVWPAWVHRWAVRRVDAWHESAHPLGRATSARVVRRERRGPFFTLFPRRGP